VKEYFTAKGVPFVAKDVGSDPAALDEMQRVTGGARTVPVIVVDGQVVMGFDRTRLQKLLGIA